MGVVRRFAVAGLDEAARRNRGRAGWRPGRWTRPGRKGRAATAGVKRQYLGCAGRVANGISTVHLSYVRQGTGHALIGARQWIPREQVSDPVTALATGLPPGLGFRTKGQLAIDLRRRVRRRGRVRFRLRGRGLRQQHGAAGVPRARGQAYVLRVASSFMLTLAAGTRLTCAQAVKRLLRDKRPWEVRSAGQAQGPAVVRLGLDRHRLTPALPAGPPAPEDRQARLPLLPRARGASR